MHYAFAGRRGLWSTQRRRGERCGVTRDLVRGLAWGCWVRAALVAPRTIPAADESCGADGSTKFICGLAAPEDLIHIPDTQWVMVAGMAEGGKHGAALRHRFEDADGEDDLSRCEIRK